MITIIDGQSKNGIGFTDPEPEITHELSFEEKEFDFTTPPILMFSKAGTIILKIDFAAEYNGDKFTVNVDGDTWTGTFKENEKYSEATELVKV